MKRILLTGMSGTGKSAVIRELVAQFDHIILLSAPVETLVERLATRTNNSYGQAPEEFGRFLDDVETVEPLLRWVASHEVRTTVSPLLGRPRPGEGLRARAGLAP